MFYASQGLITFCIKTKPSCTHITIRATQEWLVAVRVDCDFRQILFAMLGIQILKLLL